MSTTRNDEAAAHMMPTGGSGEIHPKVPGDGPQTTHGHKPGVLTGKDQIPESHVQTLPPGSAPANATYRPNPQGEIPPSANKADDVQASAADTLGGTTSADMHQGMGHPGQGMTSAQLHHDGQQHRKNAGQGLQGVGAPHQVVANAADPHDPQFAHLRALDKDEAKVGRGNVGGPAAEDRIPESAETVAGENKIGRDTRSYANKN